MNSLRNSAFTLVEILAATAILSLMFTIMFGILQQTSIGWQAANRKVEASQAARLALEQIGTDLENCVAVIQTNVPLPGTTRLTNYAFGFVHSNRTTTFPGLATGAQISQPNDLIFVATPFTASGPQGSGDLGESGYVPIYISANTNVSGVRRGRYALLRHMPMTNASIVDTAAYLPVVDFWTNSPRWEQTPALVGINFNPFVDHCVRFQIRFLYTNNLGALTYSDSWGRPSTTTAGGWINLPGGASPGLPLAAEITLGVLDERSSERIYRLTQGRGLNAQQIGAISMTNANLSSWTGNQNDPVRLALLEGLTLLQRTVYFKNR